jgi:hypothetical protein
LRTSFIQAKAAKFTITLAKKHNVHAKLHLHFMWHANELLCERIFANSVKEVKKTTVNHLNMMI